MPMPPPKLEGPQQAATYHRGWRRFFWDHLWPAKHKWGGATDEQDFKITVAARMKPLDGEGWLGSGVRVRLKYRGRVCGD